MSKSKPKLTEWLGPRAKPAIAGWYEREYKQFATLYLDWFDGANWWFEAGGIDGLGLHPEKDVPDKFPSIRWRGLTEDPSKKG